MKGKRTTPHRSPALSEIADLLQAVTFDFWGTLVDDTYQSAGVMRPADKRKQFFRQRLAELGIELTPARVAQAYQHVRAEFDVLWQQQQPLGARLGIRIMLEYLHLSVSAQIESELVHYFEHVLNEYTLVLYPGTAQAVKNLSRHFRLGIISDTAWAPGNVLRDQLRRHGILECFTATLFSDEVGHSKPHPRLFALACQRLAAPASRCLHVGDLPHTDIKGARNAGFYAAWLRRANIPPPFAPGETPHFIIESVVELEQALCCS